MSDKKLYLQPETLAVHAGTNPEVGQPNGIEVPLSSSWVLPESGDGGVNQDYGRVGSNLMSRLEEQVGALEHAKYTWSYGSGITALTACAFLLKQGDTVLLEEVLYGNTVRMMGVFKNFGINPVYLDFTKEENIQKIAEIKPAMVVIESPCNPLLKILDIRKISEVAHDAGSLVLFDNSLGNSVNQQALRLGADLVAISLTKYHNGHSTGMCGAVCTNNPKLSEKLYKIRKAMGLQPGALELTTTIQGTQTLPLRMEKISANALFVAKFLEIHPKVNRVFYPFLKSHPQYKLAIEQMKYGSGVIAVDFDIPLDKIDTFADSLNPIFVRSHSLGSVKSQVSVPSKMSHADVPREQRLKAGITDGLVRMSIGLENTTDLIDALKRGFKAVGFEG